MSVFVVRGLHLQLHLYAVPVAVLYYALLSLWIVSYIMCNVDTGNIAITILDTLRYGRNAEIWVRDCHPVCSPATTSVGLVQAWVVQNVTFSRPPSGEWLARRRMRSDGDDLGGKGRADSPP